MRFNPGDITSSAKYWGRMERTMPQVQPGRYRHYKGKYYAVLGLARHSETSEELVVYKALYATEFGGGSLWVRPKKMFLDQVVVDGQQRPRFEYVGGN
jgi:hypothetical protein